MRVARHARCALPAGDRHRPRRRLRAPVRHLGAAAGGRPRAARAASCSTSSAAMRRCWRPARSSCRQLTGVPTVATLPMWWRPRPARRRRRVRRPPQRRSGRRCTLTVAVVAYPRISNLDEFQPLKQRAGRAPALGAQRRPTWRGADWIVLPGSKHTSGDLAWLRAQGLDRADRRACGARRRGAGHLRRPADAGRGADRPARHRRQRGPGPRACCRWSRAMSHPSACVLHR